MGERVVTFLISFFFFGDFEFEVWQFLLFFRSAQFEDSIFGALMDIWPAKIFMLKFELLLAKKIITF